MRKTGLTAPRLVVGFAAAIAASMALPARPGHAAEESKSETIGPWEIAAIFKGDRFDRCAIDRTLRDDIVVRFVRTANGLSLELESPNWKLEPRQDLPGDDGDGAAQLRHRGRGRIRVRIDGY
jgi:hypothetical protein